MDHEGECPLGKRVRVATGLESMSRASAAARASASSGQLLRGKHVAGETPTHKALCGIKEKANKTARTRNSPRLNRTQARNGRDSQSSARQNALA